MNTTLQALRLRGRHGWTTARTGRAFAPGWTPPVPRVASFRATGVPCRPVAAFIALPRGRCLRWHGPVWRTVYEMLTLFPQKLETFR